MHHRFMVFTNAVYAMYVVSAWRDVFTVRLTAHLPVLRLMLRTYVRTSRWMV